MTRDSFDEARVDAEARTLFDEARKALMSTGAIEMLTQVAEILPHVKLEVYDDFDKAGGSGYSPRIHLKGEEDIVIENEGTPEETITAIQKILRVNASTSRIGRVSVDVWQTRTRESRGSKTPSGGRFWDPYEDYSNPSMLGPAIYEGLGKILPIINGSVKQKLDKVLYPR